MKIRNRHLVRFVGWTAANLVRSLVGTLRFEYARLGVSVDPADRDPNAKSIIALWHEHLLLPAVRFGGTDKAALVSEHTDGQLLSGLLRNRGMEIILGSTNRNGVQALRKMMDPETTWQHLVVTPDGPRGPRRIVQPGIVFVAAKTGMPIIPLGVGLQRNWRLKSWDRFAIPQPFSRARLVSGESIFVPREARKDGLEPFRIQVQNEMDRLTRIADEWAKTGVAPDLVRTASSIRLAS